MHAILAFKRPSLIEGRYQLAYEIRNFGCFNGFNTPDAFTTHPTHNGAGRFDVIFDGLMENGALPPDYFWGGVHNPQFNAGNSYHRPKNELNFDNVTVTGMPSDELLISAYTEEGRPWECIAIGYLAYAVAGCGLQYQAPAVQNPTTGHWVNPQWNGYFQPQASSYGMNGRVTALLNRNRISSTYYNHYSGDTMTSHRDPTDNEKFLQSFLHSMRAEVVPAEMRYSLKSSRMIIAICHAADYHELTFDLVGSERPSGLAVSYLQAYRNISEKIWNGMKGTIVDKASETCLLSLAENWPYSQLDPIPLMSYVCNNGDDSDIIAFAGQKFVMYATKMGLFNCANLYRRSDSMLIEGRYNKGGQSLHISNEMTNKIAARGPQVYTAFDQAMATVTKLNDFNLHLRKQPDVNGLAASLQTYATSVYQNSAYTNAEKENRILAKATEQAADVANWLSAHGRHRVKELVLELRRAATALTSFRTRQSNIELAPNPLGFTAWVRQAEGAGVEGATAEGIGGESAEIPRAGAAPGNPFDDTADWPDEAAEEPIRTGT